MQGISAMKVAATAGEKPADDLPFISTTPVSDEAVEAEPSTSSFPPRYLPAKRAPPELPSCGPKMSASVPPIAAKAMKSTSVLGSTLEALATLAGAAVGAVEGRYIVAAATA